MKIESFESTDMPVPVMEEMSVTQPVGAVRTLLSGTYRDARFSLDGASLYASSGNIVSVVDVATGAVTATYDLGRAIGALDLSADGRFLAATSYPGGPQTSATFFRVDLTNGAVETHSFATTATDPNSLIAGDFMDIVQLSGNRYLATQQVTGGLIQIDLSGATPAISRIAASFSIGFLEASPDHTRATVLAPSIYSYVDGSGITGVLNYDPYSGVSIHPGPPLLGATASTYSPTGNLLLIGGGAYNSFLAPQSAVQAQIHVPINQAAFSADGSRVYALTDNVVTVIDTANWQALAVYPLGVSSAPDVKVVNNAIVYSGFGDTLELSADGRHLSVITASGVILLDLQIAAPMATPGSDDLRGLSVEIGLGGDDLLGGAGGILLYGGAGNDQYTIVDGNGRIVEYVNEGTDTALVGIASYVLPQFVENGTLTIAAALSLQGNEGDNVLIGNDGANYLTGAGGNDTIDGGDGADLIRGDFGDDVLIGGMGADNIFGDYGNDWISGGGGADTIAGWDGNDQISGGDDADTIDGEGGADQINGDDGNDTINGGLGADTLNGGNGDDIIVSNSFANYAVTGDDLGAEIDVVTAGAGSDLVSIGYGDRADGGDGFDTLYLSLYAAPAGFTLDTAMFAVTGPISIGSGTITGFERLARLRGSEFADRITVSGLTQPVTIVGGNGNDVVISTGSQIAFDGGSGNDTMDYSQYSTGITVTFTDTYLATGPGGDSLKDVETVIGTAFDDVLTGTNFMATLRGGAGNDWLSRTNTGALYGGTGDDTYVIYSLGAGVVEAANEGIDTIRSYVNFTNLAPNVENLIYLGTVGTYVIGNTLGNVIVGGIGNDSLFGNGGIDSLMGKDGNDYLVVGAGNNGSVIDGGTGLDTLVVTGSVSLGGLTGIEAIELQSGAALTLTGAQFNAIQIGSALSGDGSITVNLAPGDLQVNAQFLTVAAGSTIAYVINGSSDSEVIKGGAGATYTINGGDGTDQIRGGSLADVIIGGDGNDKVMGARGADALTGGAGADTFRYQSLLDSGLGADADRITDFVSGVDKLGFALLDANPNTPAIDAFGYIDTQAFHANGAAEIRYETAGADLMVQIDANGDGVADMAIYLNGLGGGSLASGDFLI